MNEIKIPRYERSALGGATLKSKMYSFSSFTFFSLRTTTCFLGGAFVRERDLGEKVKTFKQELQFLGKNQSFLKIQKSS